MTLKEALPVIIGCITLMGIGYGAAVKGGWIIGRVEAQDIAAQAVQPEEQARLELHLELKYNRLRFLNGLSEKTPDDQLEIDSLREDIRLIKERLADLE